MKTEHKEFFEKVAALCHQYDACIFSGEDVHVSLGACHYYDVSFSHGVATQSTNDGSRPKDFSFTGAHSNPCFDCGRSQIDSHCHCENDE